MASYFLDDLPNKNGIRKVRSAFCPDLPDFYGRIYLGEYDRFESALKKAETFGFRIEQCAGCSASDSAKNTCWPVKLVS